MDSRVTTASPEPLDRALVVEVRLLGPIELVDTGGRAVELPSVTQRRLLAMLALQRGHAVRGELLADHLDLSAGALRKVVSRLRDVLGDHALRTTTGGYLLDLEVDADQFAAVARGPRTGHDRTAQLEGALARWRGNAIDEFAAEPWAIGQVARLDALRDAAIEELADRYIESNRADEAIALLAPHLARHSVADAPRSLLLRALSAAGRPSEAMRAFQDYRTTLGELTGMEPGAELREVERRIALGWNGVNAPATPAALRGPSTVPLPATRWVGPVGPLERVAEALDRHRLVTLTGPGGVGKTRTAVEVARRRTDRFADGTVLVELAAISEATHLPDLVASTLGVPTQAGLSVILSIVDRLNGRDLLLILDNCEQVVDAAAELARTLVAGCESITVLATSREPLGARGERVVTVRPLALETGVELFCERALAVDDEARFAATDLDDVERICARLDGLPLALELAAARTRSLSPADLLARLDDRFEILGSGRDGPQHQRTLWATIDWSYRLLDAGERLLFDQLAVFAGTFDLAAVEEVCRDGLSHPVQVGSLLSALVDKSMVSAERSGDSVRYRLLETIRQFAAVRLSERGLTAIVTRRHLEHYTRVAEAADALWFSTRQVDADDCFDREWDNLRAAHAAASMIGDHTTSERLLLATNAHSQLRMRSEHAAWCSTTVAHHEAPSSASLLGWTGWWAMISGEHRRAIELCGQGLAVAAPLDDPGASVCRSVLAFALWSSGRRDEAGQRVAELESVMDRLPPWFEYTAQRALFSFSVGQQFEHRADRIATIAESIAAPALVASARFYQGSAKMSVDNGAEAARAVELHEQGIMLARSARAELPECQNLQGLLDAKVALDAVDVVEVCLRAVRRMYELRYWLYLYRVLDGAAWLLARAGQTETAALLVGHLDRHAPPWRSRPRLFTRQLLEAAGVAPTVADRGAALDREHIVRLALDGLESLPTA